MIIDDLLSKLEPIVGLLGAFIASLALIIPYLAYKFQINHSKRQNCIELFKIWSSTEMYRTRWTANNWIEEDILKNKEPTKFGFSRDTMEKYAPDISNNVGIIGHFMADINSLLENNLIDKNLTQRLFWDTSIKDWYEHFYESYDPSGHFYEKNSDLNREFFKLHIESLKSNMTLKSSAINTRVNPELKERLQDLARDRMRSESSLVAEAVSAYVDREIPSSKASDRG